MTHDADPPTFFDEVIGFAILAVLWLLSMALGPFLFYFGAIWLTGSRPGLLVFFLFCVLWGGLIQITFWE